MPFMSWILKRVWCAIRGHRMQSARVYHTPAKSVVPGFACSRCGHTQQLLRRWQETHSEGGDG